MGIRAVACAALVCAAACGGKSGSYSIEARWEARADTDCSRPGLELKLVARDVLLRAGGYEIRSEDGLAKLLIPAADLGDADTVRAEVVHGNESIAVDVKVPEARRRSIAFPERPDSIDLPWNGDASLTVEGTNKGSYAWGARSDEAGRLLFGLPCATASATAEGGEFERIDDAPFIAVDVSESLRNAESVDGKLDLNIRAELTFDRSNGSMDFTGKLDVGRIAAARYGAIAAHPLDWAPAFKKGSRQSVMIVGGGEVNATLLSRGPATAALVAVVTPTEHDGEQCGPYRDDLGIEDVFLPRTRIDSTVAVYEAKTGTKIGETTLEATLPRCPRTARGYRAGGDLGSDDRVVGRVPTKQIIRWISKQR